MVDFGRREVSAIHHGGTEGGMDAEAIGDGYSLRRFFLRFTLTMPS